MQSLPPWLPRLPWHLRVARHHVGHEAFVAGGVFAREDDASPHPGVRAEHGFDLPEFDPEAANLDLMVDTAEELQLAVLGPAREVAAAIHAGAGLAREGLRYESLGRERRSIQVAPSEPHAGDVQLTGYADRHGSESRVEQIDTGVVDGATDGEDRQPLVRTKGRGVDGALGGDHRS